MIVDYLIRCCPNRMRGLSSVIFSAAVLINAIPVYSEECNCDIGAISNREFMVEELSAALPQMFFAQTITPREKRTCRTCKSETNAKDYQKVCLTDLEWAKTKPYQYRCK